MYIYVYIYRERERETEREREIDILIYIYIYTRPETSGALPAVIIGPSTHAACIRIHTCI